MRSLFSLLTSLAASTLASLSLAGLIFPGHIFANPASFTKPLDRAAIQLEILEVRDDGMPIQVQITAGDRTIAFDLDGSQYNWAEIGNPDHSGSIALPSFDKALRWEISAQEDSWFEGQMPAADLGYVAPVDDALWGLGKTSFDGEDALPGVAPTPMADLMGTFDAESGAIALTSQLPDGQRLEVDIVYADPLDFQKSLQPSAVVGKGIIIFWIPIAVLIELLGVFVVACGILTALCFTACNLVCGNGVLSVTSLCGVGCECKCLNPQGAGGGPPNGPTVLRPSQGPCGDWGCVLDGEACGVVYACSENAAISGCQALCL